MPLSSRPERLLGWLPFVGSAALVAAAIHLSFQRPLLGLILVELALILFVPQFLARRKLRRMLRAGNVEALLSAWQPSLERAPHPETMTPLITATALAAHGLVDRARATLQRAHRGPAWDAAIEQRLVVDTLLFVYDGDTERAIERAATLGELPLPASPFWRERVVSLRSAMIAFARAFAHRSDRQDLRTLETASRRNPLIYWPLRYAAAVVSIDVGRPEHVARLLSGAPHWPRDSVFASFHEQIQARAGGEGPASPSRPSA